MKIRDNDVIKQQMGFLLISETFQKFERISPIVSI